MLLAHVPRRAGAAPRAARRLLLCALLACAPIQAADSPPAATAAAGSAVPGAAAPAAAASGTVLITGSNRGIGLELARQYAARGWTVIATTRHPLEAADLQKIAAAHPNVQLEALDVADPASISALAAKLKGRTIDVLLHNAGISGGVPNQIFGRMNYAALTSSVSRNAA